MREGWTYKKLGEVATLYDSQRKPVTKKDRKNGIYPYYGASGIQDYVDTYIFDGRYLLLGEDGAKWGANEKSAFIVEGKIWVNNHAHIMTLDNYVKDRFVEYYLNGKDLNEYITGAVVPKLTQASLTKIPIPIPPLSEQERIVSELDLLSSIIEKKKEQLKEYDQLAQSIFYDMFGDPVTNERGWEVKKIEDICVSIVRGPFGSALKKEFFVEPNETTYKIYEQKHAIQKNATIGSYYVTEEKFKELSRFELTPYDIIMSCSGTIGELYRLPSNAEKGLMNQALLKFTLNDRVCYEYFSFMMEYMKHYFTVRGSGLQNIGSVKIIKSMPFGLPPLSIQQSFAEKIEAIERQKELIKQSIAETETLFNSRMDYYFN